MKEELDRDNRLRCQSCEYGSHSEDDSEAILKWCQLVSASNSPEESEERIERWLENFKGDASYGNILAQLVLLRPTERYIGGAREWLENRQITWPSEVDVLASLVLKSPAADVIERAFQYVSEEEHYFSNVLIDALIRTSDSKQSRERLVQLMESNPSATHWNIALSSLKSDPEGFAESLKVRWIELNSSDPNFNPIIFSGFPLPSAKILRAAYKWLEDGGQRSEHLVFVLCSLLLSSYWKKSELLPEMVTMALNWLKSNPDHEDSQKVVSTLLQTTRKSGHVALARACINNKKVDSASVLYSILETYRNSEEPVDQNIVGEVKATLRSQNAFATANTGRYDLLAGALLEFCIDDETVQLAKEAFRRSGDLWVLQRLLEFLPDDEVIDFAIKSMERWSESQSELDLLESFLQAAPDNPSGIDYAKNWLQKNADSPNAAKIEKLLER
ncbi:MAG: hypothetical protein R3C24_13990 [Cyanobacteriota/Melainabacteria group bacterium]|nr:hypothetical protein [Cyanobacteria bacterium HKST-UBA01]